MTTQHSEDVRFTAKGRVPFDNAQAVTHEIADHLESHNLEGIVQTDGRYQFQFADNTILIGHDAGSVSYEISAASENGLLLLRAGAARQVAEVDASAPDRMVWEDGGAQEGLPENFRELTLKRKRKLGAQLLRLTFEGRDLDIFASSGLHIRFFMQSDPRRVPVWPTMRKSGAIAMPDGADALHTRVYTIREVRPAANEVDIDFVVHTSGVATEWAMSAVPGSLAGMTGPGGGFIPPSTDWLLMGGDLTATPAICRLLELLPKGACGEVFLTLPTDMTEVPHASAPRGIKIHRVATGIDPSALVNAMQSVRCPEAGSVYGWFAGEFDQAQAMRRYFKSELGLAKKNQLSVAYWRRGQAGE